MRICPKHKKGPWGESKDMRECHFIASGSPFAPSEKNLFGKKTIIISFRIIRKHHFQAQNGPFAPKKIFFRGKLFIYIIYIYLFFLCAKLKEMLRVNLSK